MIKPTIESIQWHLVDVEESLKNFHTRQKEQRDLNAVVYEESSTMDYIEDINLIVEELKYLTRASNIFLRTSTIQDRRNLASWLSNLVLYLDRDDFTNIEWIINAIKPILRGYNTIIKKDFAWNLQKVVAELESLKIKTQSWLTEITEIEESLNEKYKDFSEKYEELTNIKSGIDEKLTDTEEKLELLNSTVTNAEEKEEEITELLNSAKSNEWIIDNFAKRVENRESQLDKQEQKTIDYQTKLTSFETERTNKLTEAQSLIDSAKEAMKYKTAEWISAAIQEQYNEAKSKWNTVPWLISAIIFLIITIILGVMIVFWWKWGLTNTTDHWSLIVWRIALLPVLIAGLIFSAGRYTKQKHIIEDYAYKMVLAKSIIGFSEQLLKVKETNDGYQEFIKQTLSQLLQDPLRDRKERQDEMVIIDKAKDIVSWVADIAGKFMPWK